MGFEIELVLADSLYGEKVKVSFMFRGTKINFVVAIRRNHGVVARGKRFGAIDGENLTVSVIKLKKYVT